MSVEFDATASLGKGFRPLAMRGRVVVTSDEVILFDDRGGEIVRAHRADVRGKKRLGGGCNVLVGDTKLFASFQTMLSSRAGNALQGMADGSRIAKEFISLVGSR